MIQTAPACQGQGATSPRRPHNGRRGPPEPGESAGRGIPQGVCPRPGASLNPEPSSPATAPPAHTPCSAGWSQQGLLQARSLAHPSGGPRAPSQPTSGNPVPPQPRFALCDVGTTLHALHSLCPHCGPLHPAPPGASAPRQAPRGGSSTAAGAPREDGQSAERAWPPCVRRGPHRGSSGSQAREAGSVGPGCQWLGGQGGQPHAAPVTGCVFRRVVREGAAFSHSCGATSACRSLPL